MRWDALTRRFGPAAHDPWSTAREAAEVFLGGQASGVQFLAAMHSIGHDGPEELQDLVELDDEYLFGNDPEASCQFLQDHAMERLVGRARQLLAPGSGTTS